jgi:hypothetical protein
MRRALLGLSLLALAACGPQAGAPTSSGDAAQRLQVGEAALQGAWVLDHHSERGADRTAKLIDANGGERPAWTFGPGGVFHTDQGDGTWRLEGRQLHLVMPDGSEQMVLVETISADSQQVFTPSYRYPHTTFAKR